MNFPTIVERYITKQSYQNWKIELAEDKYFDNVIVIPAKYEFENVPCLLNTLELNSQKILRETLILFVVNNNVSDSFNVKTDNHRLISFLKKYIANPNSMFNIGFIDASSDGKNFDDKNGGVGLARKLGMDLALMKFNYNSVSKKKILISLDADCKVSPNYLQTIHDYYNSMDCSAATIGFSHELPEEELKKRAIINYEIFLRYYVLGLQYANSEFAYHALGSIISCDFESYIKAGGMNRRKAGEDFYFLEKLIKTSKVHKINEALVYPSSRTSERVPFGTGPRIKRFLNQSHDEFKLYSPDNFHILKEFLELSDNVDDLWHSKIILRKGKRIHRTLYNFLEEQNFEKSWNKVVRNSKSNLHLRRQFTNWMDGFRTLKLIHHLRDNLDKNIDMFEAINKLLIKNNVKFEFYKGNKIPPIEIQLEYLKLLRTIT